MTIAGAGEVHARCGSAVNEATARLLERTPGLVFTAGDNAGARGTDDEYRCYDATWGRVRERTRPAPGNHDYLTRGAAGYFRYYGDSAGRPGQGYYSYEAGAWHVVVLNSNCSSVGGCGVDSPQGKWLRDDLSKHRRRCVLAYWHHPRFSSAQHGDSPEVAPFWQMLYEAGADVVIAAHDKVYERFAPQDPDGRPDPERGIRQFTVGTAGEGFYRFTSVRPNSEVRQNATHGVLRLRLTADGYEWAFLPVDGPFSDAGAARCH